MIKQLLYKHHLSFLCSAIFHLQQWVWFWYIHTLDRYESLLGPNLSKAVLLDNTIRTETGIVGETEMGHGENETKDNDPQDQMMDILLPKKAVIRTIRTTNH